MAQLEHQEKLITQLKNEQLEADLTHMFISPQKYTGISLKKYTILI